MFKSPSSCTHYTFLPPTEQGRKGFGETGLCLLQKEGRCALKSSYTIPNAVHSTDLLVNGLAHK